MIQYATLTEMLDARSRGSGAIGYLEGEGVQKNLALSDLRRLLWRLRPHALDLVAAFDVRPGHVRAPIALGGEQERQDEAAAYHRAQRASSDAPVSEKVLRDRAQKDKRAQKK